MKYGSVTRAAAKLGVAQPVVTAHIRSLEGRLGVKIVQRSGRGIALTPAGEIVYRWATEVVNDTRHLEASLKALTQDGADGLSVTTGINGSSNGIASAVVRFQIEHPGTRLEFRVLPTDQAITAVLTRESDYGVVSYLSGIDLNPELRTQRIARDELILVASPGLADSTLGPSSDRGGDARAVTAAQLATIPFVCTPGATVRRAAIDSAMLARGVNERHLVMEVRSETAFHAAVRDGIGFALLSRRTTVEMIRMGQLIEIGMPGGPIPLAIDLVSRRDLHPRPLHRLFREAVQAELHKRAPTAALAEDDAERRRASRSAPGA